MHSFLTFSVTALLSLSAFSAPAGEDNAKWPSSSEAVEFQWQDGHRILHPSVAYSASGEAMFAYSPAPRGNAIYGRNYEMILNNGSFEAVNITEHLVNRIRKTNAFSFEAWITRSSREEGQTGCIISLTGKDKESLFRVEQKKDELIFQVLAPEAPGRQEAPQAVSVKIPESQAFHVAACLGSGSALIYINGKLAHQWNYKGDFSGWTAGTTVFGADADQNNDWAGRLEGIAVYSRTLTAQEAAANSGFWAALVKTRPPADKVRLKGTLLQKSHSEPDKLGSYFRALGLFEYKVDEVLEGSFNEKSILVFHWTVMHRKTLPIDQRELNKSYEIVVEPFALHPELEPELQFDSIKWNYTDPVYYCVTEQQ